MKDTVLVFDRCGPDLSVRDFESVKRSSDTYGTYLIYQNHKLSNTDHSFLAQKSMKTIKMASFSSDASL